MTAESWFLPYQRRWIDDDAPLKIYEKSRRIGITYATSFRCVQKCLREKPGTTFTQWVSSRDELTAKEFVTGYVASWAREANRAASDLAALKNGFSGARGLDGSAFEPVDETRGIGAFTVRFRNGARICSLSSNPLAFAGKGGDVLIDEMDLHADQETLYAMAQPCTTWGGQLEIVSAYSASGSPGSVFARLCEDCRARRTAFSHHRTTLDDAIAEGFVEKINEARAARGMPVRTREVFRAEIRAACLTQSAFDTQYLCEPNRAAGSQALRPEDLLRAKSSAPLLRRAFEGSVDDRRVWDPAFWRETLGAGPFALGYDVARTGDLSAVWVSAIRGGTYVPAALATMKDVKFAEQLRLVRALMESERDMVGAGDKTGLGMAVCEELEDRFGPRFSGVNFSSSKLQLGTLLQSVFEQGRHELPAAHPDVAADLASLRCEAAPSGRMLFTEARNPMIPDSHADLAWACALAVWAGETMRAPGPCSFEPAMEPPSSVSAARAFWTPERARSAVPSNPWI